MNTIILHHQCPVRLAGPLRIECVSGIVWLTITGGAGDLFLRAGDHLMLPGGAAALAEALGAARVDVHPAPSLWARGVRACAAMLSWAHERVRIVPLPWRRTPVAG